MPLIDISRTLHEGMAVYEGDPPFRLRAVSRVIPGDPESWSTSLLEMCTHAGTHVDPPLHLLPAGASAEQLELRLLCGPARVVHLPGRSHIDALTLGGLDLRGVERLLLRTDASDQRGQGFRRDYPHLTLDGARLLRDRTTVRLVGIDTPSIEAFHSVGYPVHRVLLEEQPPMVVVEGLDLGDAPEGDYELLCLPLRLRGGDGGPARAVLRT